MPKRFTRTLRRAEALVAAGLTPRQREADAAAVAARYAVAVTPAMAELIDAADPADPIARQFLPDVAELADAPEELADPIGDAAHSPTPGIVHRYRDRALLKLTHVCPVYCRFCFRREMVGPGKAKALSAAEREAAFAYIARTPAIWEVIVTGGDPFALPPKRIAEALEALDAIGHVRVLRFHTRVPTVAPDLVTAELVAALKRSGKTLFVALHANHPREFTPQARAAVARLVDAGVPMLSQSVLLKGVNDDIDTLIALMRGFVEMRVKPYYLHHGDLARGTAHFRTTLDEGRALMRALRAEASGICQPVYMLESPGGAGKAPVL